MLNPLLYSLFTHDCVAKHASNSISKLTDDTTVVGLTENDDTRRRCGVLECGAWKITSHSMLSNLRRWSWTSGDSRGSTPLSTSTGLQWRRWKLQVPRRTHHWQTEMVHPHRQCGEEGATSGGWRNVAWHRELSLTFTDAQLRASFSGCITAWNDYCTARNRRALQRVVRSAQHIT
jgi:hypothetical protein